MKKRVRQVLCIFLAMILLSQETYADVTTPAVSIETFASLALPATSSDAFWEDGELFYYDEDGNKVYDSDIDWSDYRMEQDDYADIMWTFEEYPKTMMSNGNSSTYIVGVDDAVIIAIVAIACAVCGYSISRSDIPEFISNVFEPWLRRNKGNDVAIMSMWQSALSAKLASAFTGMTLLVKTLWEFFSSGTKDSISVTFPVNLSTWDVVSPLPDWNKNFGEYLAVFNTYVTSGSGIEYLTYAFYKSDIDSLVGGYLGPIQSDGKYNVSLFTSSNSRDYLPLTEISNTLKDGYWSNVRSYSKSGYYPVVPLDFIYSLKVPIFVNRNAYDSWKNFGTMGGLLNADADSSFTVKTANQWTDLQRDFFNKYAFSDVLTIPETQAEFDVLVDSLSQAQTGADVITNLNRIWTITPSGSTISTRPYTDLAYILDSIAVYVGAPALTAEIRNGFLADYLNVSLADSSVEKLNTYSLTVLNTQVSIKGNSDDNGENDFTVTQVLVSAFVSYLIAQGIIDSSVVAPDAGVQVQENVKVADDVLNPDVPGGNEPILPGVDFGPLLTALQKILDAVLALSGIVGLTAIVTSIRDWLVQNVDLSGIKSILTSIKDFVSSIPGTLSDILDGILAIPGEIVDSLTAIYDVIVAIPGQITDFFTVDTAIVGAAAIEVQGAFSARFGGITQLKDVFTKSYSLGMEVPVFTMPVPDFLKFAYPDTDEIVVLDLRPYATYLLWARGILIAIIWVMFAKWLLDQFDVKFHVG